MYKSRLKNVLTKMRKAAALGCDAAAAVYSIAIKQSLGGPSPSSPGNPPGMRSGRLRTAIAIGAGIQKDDAVTYVGIDTSVGGVGRTPPWLYGIFLEEGASAGRPRPFRLADGSWRMRKNPMFPRPFMRPMLTNSAVGNAALKKFNEVAKKEME